MVKNMGAVFRRVAMISGLSLLLALPAAAQTQIVPQEVAASVNSAKERGRAQVRWLGLKIYTARLFTTDGEAFDWTRSFALELTYDRRFSAASLSRASGKELARLEGRQSDHPEILQKLAICYQDVKAGDRFVALGRAKDQVDFLLNGRQTCQLKHDNIRQRLLSIWLSDDARDPDLSRQLRGL
jgi:hypothetical protein